MNFLAWAIAAFAATTVLTSLLAASQGFGFTRINLPYLLGTMLTGNRDKANVIGLVLHFVNGCLFSLIYMGIFYVTDTSSMLIGAIIGFVHAAFVLTAGMAVLPALHPRMADETDGPTTTRQLEPPGFLALHYGYATPISIILAHIFFGAILGFIYQH